MEELTITWQRVARIWWLIVWRATLGGLVLGAIIGGIIGFIEGAMGLSLRTIAISSQLPGAIVGIIWSLAVVHMALRKKYIDFRLALVAHSSK
jgi:hypothetical protein